MTVCVNERGDDHANDVRIRVQGAPSDLHAAEAARYHDKCRKVFMNPKQFKAVQKSQHNIRTEDTVASFVVEMIKIKNDRTWTSVQIHSMYIENGGKDMKKNRLVDKIKELLEDEIIVLSSPGFASIIMLKQKASGMFRLEDSEDDDDDIHVQTVARKIRCEIKNISSERSHYKPLTNESLFEDVSSTLMLLLSLICTTLDKTLPAAMVGSIITSSVSKFLKHSPKLKACTLEQSKVSVTSINVKHCISCVPYTIYHVLLNKGNWF